MTVFVYQNKFFSEEYFGSSFKIILVVFYVLSIWDTVLKHFTVQKHFILQWLGGLPGVTSLTNFIFLVQNAFSLFFDNLKMLENGITLRWVFY